MYIFTRFKKQVLKNQARNRGQGLVEYALLLVLVGLVVIAIVQVMEPAIGDVFSRLVHKNVVAPPSLAGYTPPPPPATPTATATYVPLPVLTVNITGLGTVDQSPPPPYSGGANVSLEAFPAPGYVFSGWGGDLSGSNNPETIHMTTDKVVSALFEPQRFWLTITETGAGIVTKNPDQLNYAPGETVIITANPDPGFSFLNWTGDISGNTNPYTIVMDSDKNIEAVFEGSCYPLTIVENPGAGGNVTANPAPNCNGTEYNHGTDVSLSAVPSANYRFDNWSGDATGTSTPVNVMMTAPRSVTANFSEIPCYNINTSAAPPSSGSVALSPAANCGSQYREGTNVTFTANPTSGNIFNSWSGDLTGNTNPSTLAINGPKIVNALFTQAPITLERRVSASYDDAEERSNGSMSRTSSDLELVYDNGIQTVGVRFQNVQIQQGATIINAYIEFTADESNSGATSLVFQGQAGNNPPEFGNSGYDISNRPRTGAAMNWNNVPSWSRGNHYQTPDITAIVQEIVNRGGWSSGNAMVFIISGTGERVAESRNGDSSAAPLLHVEFINP